MKNVYKTDLNSLLESDWRKTEEELEKSKKWEKSILLLTENNKKIGL